MPRARPACEGDVVTVCRYRLPSGACVHDLVDVYGRPMTLGEVGLHFHLTRERMRQIEHRAFAKLAAKLAARGLSLADLIPMGCEGSDDIATQAAEQDDG